MPAEMVNFSQGVLIYPVSEFARKLKEREVVGVRTLADFGFRAEKLASLEVQLVCFTSHQLECIFYLSIRSWL